jgi:phosphosulfolactate synthase
MNLLNLKKNPYGHPIGLSTLNTPQRTTKPRKQDGLTILIDRGIPTRYFCDVIDSFGDYVDIVKFGWGSSLVTPDLGMKIACLLNRKIDFFFGGTLFEKFVHQGKFDEFYAFLRKYRPHYVEISDGTIELDPMQRHRFIERLSQEFIVFSEVGYKDAQRSEEMCADQWIDLIQKDFLSGARKVILEARESGSSGICQSNGSLREDIISQIVGSGISPASLIFEAPNSALQSYLIKRFGANVNLANVPFEQALNLESLRLGLRSDTFYAFQPSAPKPEAPLKRQVVSARPIELIAAAGDYDYQI